MAMHVLIIGGSRFTGPAVIERLAAADHQITVFNRGNHNIPTEVPINHVVGDRHNDEALLSSIETHSFDVIVDTCAYEPADVEPLIQSDCSPDHYICYSTAGVYSDDGVIPFRETDKRGENQFWGEYGASKATLENRLFRATNEVDFPATVLRFPYIYGPRNHLYRETELFDRIRDGEPVPIPSDGQALLQFVYVTDVAKAVEAVIESGSRDPVGEAYNVAEPHAYTYQRLVEIIGNMTDSNIETVQFEPPNTATAVFNLIPFGSRHLQMDISKWMNFANYNFKTLQEGLTRTFEWYETETRDYDDEYVF